MTLLIIVIKIQRHIISHNIVWYDYDHSSILIIEENIILVFIFSDNELYLYLIYY